MTSKNFIYAIRDINTGKIINSKCNNGGKYYQNVIFAKRRLDALNNKEGTKRYELVTYELKELK